MLLDGRIDQVGTESTEALKGADVIQSDQTTVTNHIGVDHGDQLPPIWRPNSRVPCPSVPLPLAVTIRLDWLPSKVSMVAARPRLEPNVRC